MLSCGSIVRVNVFPVWTYVDGLDGRVTICSKINRVDLFPPKPR